MTKARERAEQLRQELARPYGGENLLEVRHLKHKTLFFILIYT